jgi:cytochrome c553
MKKYSLVVLILSLLVVGCGDKKDDKSQTKDTTTQTKAPMIEVSENENSKQIKVQEKHNSKDKNKSYYLNYGVKSEYDLKAQPANKDASVRVRPRTVLDANMHIRSPYERIQISLIVRQLSLSFKIKCSACHDDYANGVIGPSLLGRDSNYIYDKIIAFKNGKKSNPLMNDLIKNMDNKEIKDIAIQIYNFNKEIEKLGARQ